MPNTREKLIELLDDALLSVDWDSHDYPDTEKATGILIAHGVTVQEWISVKDRLPEEFDKVLAVVKEDGYERIGFFVCSKGKWWDCFYNGFHNVTHWMPLPQPPKGE